MDNSQYVEVMTWLQIIGNNSRMMREAMEGRAGANSPGGGNAGAGRADPSMLDRLGTRIENAITSRMGQALGQANSLAKRGFAGTIEQAQNDLAMERLARQFAAVMSPALAAMTAIANHAESAMSRMGTGEQNRLMGMIIGGGLGMRYGGGLGAIAGASVGALMMGGNGPYDGLMGMAAGAYTGYRVGRMFGPTGAVAGTVAGGAVGYVAGEGDYGRLRAKGNNKFLSGAGATFAAAGDLMHENMLRYITPDSSAPTGDVLRRSMGIGTSATGLLGDMAGRLMGRVPGVGGRRDVTPFNPDMLEAGGFAGVMQREVILKTLPPGFEADQGPLGPLVKIGEIIIDHLAELIRVGGGRAPRSAAE